MGGLAEGRGRGRRAATASLCRLLPALRLDMMGCAIDRNSSGVSITMERVSHSSKMSSNDKQPKSKADLGHAPLGGHCRACPRRHTN